MSQDQVHEIAFGLELSELPFLWALRKPNWAIEDAEALPSGFSDGTSGRGVVCMGWAPQMEILARPSIGGSLLHSGWGSVIETLQFGHCPIVLPFVIDQGLNARLLVEKGKGLKRAGRAGPRAFLNKPKWLLNKGRKRRGFEPLPSSLNSKALTN